MEERMATFVQLGDVRTWYDEHGAGDPLVLMHGGLVDAGFFASNIEALAVRFHVYTPERRGHGHSPDVDGPITTSSWLTTRSRSWIRSSGSPPIFSVTATVRSWRCW
jgi:pimeloyl-ACP methyl ester carboxylesterase